MTNTKTQSRTLKSHYNWQNDYVTLTERETYNADNYETIKVEYILRCKVREFDGYFKNEIYTNKLEAISAYHFQKNWIG